MTTSVEWQDIFEGKCIIIDEDGVEYEWDSSKKNEIGTVYGYSLIKTHKKSTLLEACLSIISSNENVVEFEIVKNDNLDLE